jgi:hypothetical protein
MIRVEKQEKIASNGVRLQHIKSIEVCGKKLNLPDVVSSYIELQDKVIILTLYPSAGLPVDQEDIDRNIFCYNKIDGSLKWQVESKEGSPYVGIDLGIKKESGEVLYGERGGITREGEWGKIESCTYLTKPFQHGSDCISAQTFSSGFYSVDIETGKVTFLYRDK